MSRSSPKTGTTELHSRANKMGALRSGDRNLVSRRRFIDTTLRRLLCNYTCKTELFNHSGKTEVRQHITLLLGFSEEPEFVSICDHNAEYLRSKRNVVLFFKSEHCLFCQLIKTEVRDIARNLRRLGVFGLVDVDKCPQMKQRYHVTQTPTFLSVKYMDIVHQFDGTRIEEMARRAFSKPTQNLRDYEEVLYLADSNMSFFLIDHYLSSEEELLLEELTPEHSFFAIQGHNFSSSIVYYRSLDRQFVEVGNSIRDIKGFLKDGLTPMFTEFTPKLAEWLSLIQDFVILILFDKEKEHFGNKEYEIMTKMADVKKLVVYFPRDGKEIFFSMTGIKESNSVTVALVKGSSLWINNNTDYLEYATSVINGEINPTLIIQ